MRKPKSKAVKTISIVLLVCFVLGAVLFAGGNALVILSAKPYLLSEEDCAAHTNMDCILVLGCAVWNNNTLSPMLEDRVETGISLYNAGVSNRLLMSGDHGQKNYDEVNNMKQYCVDAGIAADVVFLDHAGFSTYESMYRMRDIFGVKKAVIVTQRYHLYRAVYIARSLGIEAYGVAADRQEFSSATQAKNALRESLARLKDIVTCIVQPPPSYLSEAIPISGSAKLSDDKEYI